MTLSEWAVWIFYPTIEPIGLEGLMKIALEKEPSGSVLALKIFI